MKKNVCEHMGFTSARRFGIEIELNAFDGKAKPDDGGKPAGIDYVGKLINDNTEEGAEVKGWEHTNNNTRWVIKPDSSCGMEICTPPVSGWTGLQKICRVVDALGRDAKIKSDKRCSVHVHVDVSDLDTDQVARILGWYIKCEPVIMDMVPDYRRINRYCQFIGMTAILSHDHKYTSQEIINTVSDYKYYSMNARSLKKDSPRKTIEFRIVEGEGCRDAFLIKNWVRFLLHFIERAIVKPLNFEYKSNDPWSHLCWLDPEDVFRFLGFSNNPQEYELSKGLQQIRNWILARMAKYMSSDERGSRRIAYKELSEMLLRFKSEGINIVEDLVPSDSTKALYADIFKY